MNNSNLYVGTVSVYMDMHHETADIGILIGEDSCGRPGVGTDAWREVVRWLIEVIHVRKVTGGTLRCNLPMVRIMEKSGMSPDGVRVAQELVDGKPQDLLYFAKFASKNRPVVDQHNISCEI
jgi:RimJ/RimL family protein N-acetyltransferase